MIKLHFFFFGGGGGGGPDMPHSFGCEATDRLQGIWFSFKSFRTWRPGVSVVFLG